MGRISRIDIQLDHDLDEHYHYRPGQHISGNVIVRVVEGEEILRMLCVHFCGSSTVTWKDELGKMFTAEEAYLNETVTLAPLFDGDILHLSPGKHEFPFTYELAEGLPSSFIGKYGSVTYVIKASAQDTKAVTISSEPFLISNQAFSFSQMTLNKSVESSVRKRYWSKYRTGHISAKFWLKKQGYSPGDIIDMNAVIVNHSPRIIKGLHAMLVMYTTFYAQNSSHTHMQIVSKRQDKWEMVRGEGRRWNNEILSIPQSVPESRLEGCDIIDIYYELVLKIEIETKKDKAKEIRLSLPILIKPTSSSDIRLRQRKNSVGRTIDRKTLESLDIGKLLDLQEEEDTPFGYNRPVDDGTLRFNPLYNRNLSDSRENVIESTQL